METLVNSGAAQRAEAPETACAATARPHAGFDLAALYANRPEITIAVMHGLAESTAPEGCSTLYISA
jgi:hypothetical protein